MAAERSIFAERGFAYYFGGQALSYVGDGLRTFALPLLVFHLTHSALSTGITYALEIVPFALVGLVGGSLADRIDRRRMMIACDLARFLIMAAFATAYYRGWLTLPMLYVGIVLLASAAAIFLGGQQSSIPHLVGTARSTKATAALIAAEQTSNLVTPPIGGAIFSVAGPLPALIANACTYLISQFTLALVPTLGPDAPGPIPSMRVIAADIARGFRHLMGDRALTAVTLTSFGLNLFGMMAVAVLIPFVKNDLAASDVVLGFAFGGISIGSILGALIAGRYASHWPLGIALQIAYALDAILYIPVMFAHSVPVFVLFSALASASGSFQVAQIVGWRMRITPSDKLGSVFGAARLVVLSGIGPGAYIGGLVAQNYDPRISIIISEIGFILIAFYMAFNRAIREERR
jgi:MFS family permease